ncbi:hypothetical protein SAMN05660860_00435 [Geoalkalibacter ferrihydriticus]|nr:hypothetical protein SAMN05660860_00435 [Geoalkalibacter ferrihydriticus]
MIDELELPQVQEITTRDLRALAEHKPPGMDGSFLQNLGRRPTRLILGGVASGPESRQFIDDLYDKFQAGVPVAFSADIVTDTAIEEMLIDDLQYRDLAGKPERFAYVVTLQEHIEPVEPEETSLLDSDILDDARGLLDDLVEGLDIGLDFSTGLERFLDPLQSLLGRLREFNAAVDRARQ